MISISFPTNGSWQLGKFVNTEEDVNGYITLKNQGTYIEITNNTGQDLSGMPFFIEFIGPDFDALKWEFTPLSVLDFNVTPSTFLYVTLADGTTIYTSDGDLSELKDVLFVIAPLGTSTHTIEYSTDGSAYNAYTTVPAGLNKLLPVNQDGIIGQHIYFIDQYGNILKFWRVAFDYTHKYTAYIIQLKTVDDVPILFANGSTIRIYIMTNATSSYAQEIMYPPFLVIHPQIPGYVAGGQPDSITLYSDEMVITQNYFTGIDTTRRLCMEMAYLNILYGDTSKINPPFGFLRKAHINSLNETYTFFTEFTPGWFTDTEISDITGWEDSDCFIQLGYQDFYGGSDYDLTEFRAYIELDEVAGDIWYGLTLEGKLVGGSSTYKHVFVIPSLNQQFLSCFTGAFKTSQGTDDGSLISCSGYAGDLSVDTRSYINGTMRYDTLVSTSRFRLYLTSGIKIYRIMQLGFIPDVLNTISEGTYTAKMYNMVRFYDIPRNLTTGGAGYWLSPIIDLGMQPPDFSISWVADETYGRIDTDNIDPKEIEWRYSIYPPDGMATGTITDSEGVEHAYWDPETTWDTASEWQKIESSEQLPPYRYAQFRISLLAD